MSITNGYFTLDEFRRRLQQANIVDDFDDIILEQVAEGVARQIDNHCGRRIYAASETRYFTAHSPTCVWVDDLLIDANTVVSTDDAGTRTYGTTWAATDYDALPDNAVAMGEPFTKLEVSPVGTKFFPSYRKGVKIVSFFGYALTTPPPIREAALLQGTRLFKRKDAPFGVLGSAEMGQLMVLPKLDPDVQKLLIRYKKL